MKSKLNKTKHSNQYLGRIKNNKYQVAELGDLCTRKKRKRKKNGEANTHGERERERERERESERDRQTWWCGTLKSF